MKRLHIFPLLGLIILVVVLSLLLKPGQNTDTIVIEENNHGNVVNGVTAPTPTSASSQSEQAAETPVALTEEIPIVTPDLEQELPPPVLSAEELSEAYATNQPEVLNDHDWNPPPLPVPLARHPYDHYWFHRPVASDHHNMGLTWYPYGSNGANDDFLIHIGIDIANPVGVDVYTAGPGTVVWSDLGHRNEYENISAYGNVIVIEHDYGYDGKAVFTLYAHLSTRLVSAGDRVESGDIIGKIGATGQVTGPHVHFEVRVDENSLTHIRNPDLWIAPYTGTGVIAGRLAYSANNSPVNDADIAVIDKETEEVLFRTTTYAGPGVNLDDNWQENFVLPNIPVGDYIVTGNLSGRRWRGEIRVSEGLTNWVTLTRQTGNP